MEKHYFVYILASQKNGTLYIGVTSNPARRIWLHREGLIEGFTKKYGVKRLVYIELLDDPTSAIAREKAMKKWRRAWRRAWKIDLIERDNPEWNDLYLRMNW